MTILVSTKIYMSCTEDTTLWTNYGCLLQLLGGIKRGYRLPEVDILPQKYLSFFFFLMGPGAPKSQAPALSPPLPYLRAGHFRAGQGQVGPGNRAWALPCTTLVVVVR